jgi:predicted aminopeptidase
VERVPLNNAVLMSRRVYAERLDRFDSVYTAAGGDIREAIARVIRAHKDSVVSAKQGKTGKTGEN